MSTDKKKIVYEDLFDFHFLSDPVVSPEGTHAVFTRMYALKQKNDYASEIWIIDLVSGEYHALTTGGSERGAFWLDKDTVAFAANRRVDDPTEEEKKDKGTKWMKISIHGGEAVPYLSVKEKAGQIKLIDEDTYVLLVNQDSEGEKKEEPNTAKEGTDFWVLDEFPFWFNGRKVINKKRNALYLHKDGETKQITPQYLDTAGWKISPDKTKIAFSGCEYKDVLSRTSGLYLYDIASGETKTIVHQGTVSVGSVYFFGDKEIFYTTLDDEKRGDNSNYNLYNMETDEYTLLPFPDKDPHGGVGTDCNMGGGNGMKYQDGYLYFTQTIWGNGVLSRMDHEGKIEVITAKEGSVSAFDMTPDGTIIMTAMRGQDLVELYALKDGKETRLTEMNQPYIQSHNVIKPEYFTFENRAGITLEGFVLKPAGFEAGKKYPGILEMHGGPKVAFGSVFHHEMQSYANDGYFVFYTNPRGSDGRGDAFAKINGMLGTIDYEDFMDFTDEMIRRYPELDEKHIGICGGSYGGYMCNWMIGQTDRYAAAASQRSISNYFTKLLCTDIGITYDLPQAGGDPWNDFDQVWEISPLKYAPHATTPTLFIQSDDDYRCWMSGAVQMFNALQQNGVPSRIALFHGETHELSRSGKPANRISRLKEMGDWFEKYLKNRL